LVINPQRDIFTILRQRYGDRAVRRREADGVVDHVLDHDLEHALAGTDNDVVVQHAYQADLALGDYLAAAVEDVGHHLGDADRLARRVDQIGGVVIQPLGRV